MKFIDLGDGSLYFNQKNEDVVNGNYVIQKTCFLRIKNETIHCENSWSVLNKKRDTNGYYSIAGFRVKYWDAE